MTAVQLKALCKEYGLKVSGKKADLKERLREHLLKPPIVDSPKDEFDEMSDEELQQCLAARGISLDTIGDRSQMLQQLRGDINFMNELQVAVPPDSTGFSSILEALQAAAEHGGAAHDILATLREKALEEPKFLDVTVTSVGMQPIKYTAGGAPSVTADVLRELAGQPFDNPPKYGLVSSWETAFAH